ncbi:hypothetical protein Cni_G26834 [Canna indica]|uniref:Uncharacterized protein n=1 Tax=Canna indica TaxID=4628 RepID=A0AAQ3L4I1_9LILI|nr:hypothetical protein Cni_G26834 [Canna indica]
MGGMSGSLEFMKRPNNPEGTAEDFRVGLAANKNVPVPVNTDAPKLPTRSPACSSVSSVASSAGVFLQVPMPTRRSAHATITGRPREEVPSALSLLLEDIRLVSV